MPGLASEVPPGHVREDMVTRSVGAILSRPGVLLPSHVRPHARICPNHGCLHACSAQTTEALEAATASLSVEAQQRAEKDAKKKAAKAEAAEQKQADKLASSVVTIKRIERNKRKFVTSVAGLEAFGLDLKKVRRNHPSSRLVSSIQPGRQWHHAGRTLLTVEPILGCERVRKEVRYGLFCDKGSQRRRGDCGPG